jgi:hypothetical protein
MISSLLSYDGQPLFGLLQLNAFAILDNESALPLEILS